MKLKIIKSQFSKKDELTISANGSIGFKKNIAEQFNVKENQRYIVAYDEEEISKNIYFFLDNNDDEGFKVSCPNGMYRIVIRNVLKKLNVKVPTKATINHVTEVIDLGNGNMKSCEGFKITLKQL